MEQNRTSGVLSVLFIIELAVSLITVLVVVALPTAPFIPIEAEVFDLSDSLIDIIVFLFFIMIAGTLLFSISIISEKRINIGKSLMLYLALFIVLTAIWIFLGSKVPYPMFKNMITVQLCSSFSYHFMPIAFLFFARELMQGGCKLMNVTIALLLTAAAGNYLYIVSGEFSFPESLIIEQALITIVIISCLWVSAIEFFKFKNENVIEILVGIAILGVFTGVELINSYQNPNDSMTFYFTVGLVCFVILLLGSIVRNIGEGVTQALKFEKIAGVIPSGVFRVKNDARMTILYANEFFYKMYGYKDESEAVKQKFTNFYNNMGDKEYKKLKDFCDKQILAGKHSFEAETRERDSKGNPVWMLNRFEYIPETDEIIGSVIDNTKRRIAEEMLRISEEEYRLAVAQSDKIITKYDVRTRILTRSPEAAAMFGVSEVSENIPESMAQSGIVAQESVQDYMDFYYAMIRGEKSGQALIRMMDINYGENRLFNAKFLMTYDEKGDPLRAIVTHEDVTVQHKKALAYEKWMQEMKNMSKESTAVYEWNLSKDVQEGESGDLLDHLKDYSNHHFNKRSEDYCTGSVYEEDKSAYRAMMNRECLISSFAEGTTRYSLDYREKNHNGELKWMRLSIQLVQYPDSDEIKAYIVFKDINEEKTEFLSIKARSEQDTLTKLLNREAFVNGVQGLLEQKNIDVQHALVMIDIDNFKVVNDTLGHMVGDEVLLDVATNLRALLREGDLIGRVGGDEFMIFLSKIPYDDVVERRAEIICKVLEKNLDQGISVSGSLGIAMFPRDGRNFEQLYHSADKALYDAKKKGRNRYVFYSKALDDSQYKSNFTPIDNEPVSQLYTEAQTDRLHMLLEQNEVLIRKQGEAEIYQNIIDFTKTIVFEWDIEKKYFLNGSDIEQYAIGSKNLEDIVGGKYLEEVFHPDDVQNMQKNFYRKLKKDGVAEIITRLKKAQGGYDWCHIVAIGSRSKNGELTRIIGTINKTDLQERHPEILLKSLMENMRSGVLIFDIGEKIEAVYISPSYLMMPGKGTAKTGDEDVYVLENIASEDIGWVMDEMRECALSGDIIDIKYGIRYLSGERRWHRMRAVTLPNVSSDNPAIIAQIDDITEEHEISVQRDALMENIPGGVLIFDIEKEDYRVRYVSPSFYTEIRKSTVPVNENMESFELLSMVHPEDRDGLDTAIRHSAFDGLSVDYQYRAIFSDGSVGWRHFKASHISQRDSIWPTMVAVITDITQIKKEEKIKKSSENIVAIAAEHADMFYWAYEIQTKTCYTGRRSQRLFGLPEIVSDYPQSLAGKGYVSSDFQKEFEEFHRYLEKGNDSETIDICFENRFQWYRVKYTITEWDGKIPVKAIGTAVNIQPLKELEAKLAIAMSEASDNKLNMDEVITALSVNTVVGIFKIRVGEEYTLLYGNNKYYEIHGYGEADADIRSRPVNAMYYIDPGDVWRVRNVVEEGFRAQKKTVELKMDIVTKQRDSKWVMVCASLREDDTGRYLIGCMSDITEQRKAIDDLMFVSQHDMLTGLYNRRAFVAKAKKRVSLKPGDYYVLSVIDIDNFKVVNDIFGHGEGDKLLQYFGSVLHEATEKNDGICCRLTGDIFATLMPNNTEELNRAAIEREEKMRQYPLSMKLVISTGRCAIDNPIASIESIIERAMLANYSVKGRYNNKTAYYEDIMLNSLIEEQEILDDMEAALEDGQFEVWFQPQCNHRTGRLVGAEALVRWRHPRKGMIKPNQFIPVFERNGFIARLDEYIWKRACDILAKWKEEGRKIIPISVNVSPLDMYDPNICEKLIEMVNEKGIPHECFKLEITESAYMENPAQIIEIVKKFQNAGFIIEMDDFGSGYSSLNTLKDVPVDILKLDMKFLAGNNQGDRSESILKSIIEMAERIGVRVIAEGVETREQADYLLSMGCEVIQGFFYSKPLTVEDFQIILEKEKLEGGANQLNVLK